ncbi:hypothetical protein LTR17_012115 [Elasticomyces elasticus]|nr:hypothetical protein LTR17_012115 [Elasticomyces elasticus]
MTEEVPDFPPWSSGDDVPADSTDEDSDSGSDESEDVDVRVNATWQNPRLAVRHSPAIDHPASARDAPTPVACPTSSASAAPAASQPVSSVSRYNSSKDITQSHCGLSIVHRTRRSSAAATNRSTEHVHPFKCPFCPEGFKRRLDLGTHIMAYDDLCDTCGRAHDSQQSCNPHMDTPRAPAGQEIAERKQEQTQDITVESLPDIEASRPQRHAQGVAESLKKAQARQAYAGNKPTIPSQVSQAEKVGAYRQGPKHDSEAVCEESYDASSSSADEDDDDSADDDLSDTSSSGAAAGGSQTC